MTPEKNPKDEINQRIDESNLVDPSFKEVAKYILSSDVKKHSLYCPCCKNYDEQPGSEPSSM